MHRTFLQQQDGSKINDEENNRKLNKTGLKIYNSHESLFQITVILSIILNKIYSI